MVVVKEVPVSISAKDRELSLAVKGAKMFNLLPRYLRDFKSDQVRIKLVILIAFIMDHIQVEHFKILLDKFLEHIPDLPVSSDKTQRHVKINKCDKENTEVESNSLIEKIPKQNSREKKEILRRQDRVH